MSSEAINVRDRAKYFARQHCRELAEEILEWQDTALLPDGRLRELAKIWAEIAPAFDMKLAEGEAIRAALEVAARAEPERQQGAQSNG